MKMYHLVEAESLWALSQRGAVNLPQVRELQQKLKDEGFDPGKVDGWYGPDTTRAVKEYQRANNLTPDGDAGPQTLAKLGMSAGSTQPTNSQPSAQQPTDNQPTDSQPSTVTGNQQQVDRAANQGGEQLARLVIAGLLGYGLYRAARNAGETPPPLGSNPTPVVPGTPTPPPVQTPSRGLRQGSSNRDAANAVASVSQNEFVLTSWTSYSSSERSLMRVEINPRGQIAAGYMQIPNNDYREKNQYEATIARYVRRQIRLIPGNISSLSVSIYLNGSFIESFETYLG